MNCIFRCMNFLAHAYLSFGQPQITVGNMISDFVKGAKKDTLPKDVRQGVMLHRAIDSFTDAHEVTARAKSFFRPHYRLYSGAIVDIIYDHYLANDKAVFSLHALETFTYSVYNILDAHLHVLPPPFLRMLPYMKRDNWLYGYRFRPGIENSLRGLAHRAAYMKDSEAAYRLFNEHYEALEACYKSFFPDLEAFARQKFGDLMG